VADGEAGIAGPALIGSQEMRERIMGTRYILSVICPACGCVAEDVYYAPTCDFVNHTCCACGTVIELEEYTGISYEDASNRQEIDKMLGAFDGQLSLKNATVLIGV